MTTDSLIPAAPPADAMEEETLVLNGLVETNLPLTAPVPADALMVGEKICVHPDDGSRVNWRVAGHHPGEGGAEIVEYRLPTDDPEAEPRTWTVENSQDRSQWLTVEVAR